MDHDAVLRWIRGFASAVADHREELVRLDTAIGDGDHGPNLDRGMRKVLEKLEGASGTDIGATLKTVGMTLEAGVKGVQARGKAEPGDKTMIDALLPAVEALRAGGDEADALRASADAAEEGMKATIPMEARKGRASYLGPRSVDHQDPGATSSHLLLRAAAEAVANS